ncbi:MAG: FkbM family methyltransferase [Pseudolabrys sp.]
MARQPHAAKEGEGTPVVSKAVAADFPGRFREIISDPLNLLIARVPLAGFVHGNEVFLHNVNRVAIAGPYAYYDKFSDILILNRGVHEPIEEYVFQEVMRQMPQAPVMVELGAYWGHYSMWLCKLRPNATAILVEPNSHNLAVGRHNFQRNGFTGEFINASVGANNFEVDSFLQSRGIAHLDVLHADIQGHEVEMLVGSRQSLERATIDYLFISTHSQPLHNKVIEELGRFGYRIEAASDFEHDTTSYDGFVFASSPRAKRVFEKLVFLGRTGIVQSAPRELVDSLLAVNSSRST